MKRKASAVWSGNLETGQGKISTESGAVKEVGYSFGSRFENKGREAAEPVSTNPEELIAAAHASCFTMALSHELEKAGVDSGKIETTATVTIARRPEGWQVTGIRLETTGHLLGGEEAIFSECARTAKENCPISKLLKAPIELETHFESTLLAS
jgi:osmotically inducible protein OsmC